MRLSNLVPPVGWITAFSAAVCTALWVQSEPPGQVVAVADLELPSPGTTKDGQAFLLPPQSDAVRAAELFATRPLLAEGRRSFVPKPVAIPTTPEPSPRVDEPEAAPQAPPDPPNVSMLGTVETANSRRVLLRDELSAAETWYKVGDAVLGWTIVEILPDKIRLQLQDAEITFNLFGE